MSNYSTTAEVDTKIADANFTTPSEVDTKIANAALSLASLPTLP